MLSSIGYDEKFHAVDSESNGDESIKTSDGKIPFGTTSKIAVLETYCNHGSEDFDGPNGRILLSGRFYSLLK